MRIIKRSSINHDKSETSPREEHVPHARGPKVITVTSGKGGVGKTNLTVNLAIALAREGRRVIIFDADLGLANVEVLLGLAPALSLFDHLYKGVPIEDTLCGGPAGIKIIPGGSGFLELANLNSKQRSRLLAGIAKLNRLADFVLIDTGAGISKDVLAFCAAADEVFVVVTPEPTSLTDAYGLIKVLDKFKLHRDVHFIVNQSRGDSEAKDTVIRLKALAGKYLSIGVNYLGDIQYDPAVVRAVKSQMPFLVSSPGSPAATSLKKITYAVLNKDRVAEHDDEQGLQGFINKLGRLFK